MYQNFIGIDIGKNDFFVAKHGEKKVYKYSNNTEGFATFIGEFSSSTCDALIVLETTGGYERRLIDFLQSQHLAVHRANTRKVKSFIRSYGQLGKSDEIDARQLSRYAYERHTTLPLFKSLEDEDLRELVGRRRELKQMLVKEKNRQQAPNKKAMKSSFLRVIEALTEEIAIINDEISLICSLKKDFKEKTEVLKTIPGVGDITSVELLATLPELGQLNRKQIASLGGLAPHPNESGKKIGYRRTCGGRGTIKSILFMAALSAMRTKTQLSDFYHRLVDAGKKKMVAITALMRKILVIANARLRDFYQQQMENATR